MYKWTFTLVSLLCAFHTTFAFSLNVKCWWWWWWCAVRLNLAIIRYWQLQQQIMTFLMEWIFLGASGSKCAFNAYIVYVPGSMCMRHILYPFIWMKQKETIIPKNHIYTNILFPFNSRQILFALPCIVSLFPQHLRLLASLPFAMCIARPVSSIQQEFKTNWQQLTSSFQLICFRYGVKYICLSRMWHLEGTFRNIRPYMETATYIFTLLSEWMWARECTKEKATQ